MTAVVAPVVVRHDAARAAASCRALLANGGDLVDAWRFGILQTVDYYMQNLDQDGPDIARQVFDREPSTGELRVDAAFSALAEYFAARDGWTPPAWVDQPGRVAPWPWFVAPLAQGPGYFHEEALRVTPLEFRQRNVYIGIGELERA